MIAGKVKFIKSKTKAEALVSQDNGAIHFTPEGVIVAGGINYTGVTDVKLGAGGQSLIDNDGKTVIIPLEHVTNDPQVKRSEMGTPGGVATLDSGGKVPASQLPSYVDDVIDVIVCYENNGVLYYTEQYTIPNSIPTPYDVNKIYLVKNSNKLYKYTDTDPQVHTTITPESGKIYVDIRTNKSYRWTGSIFAEISASLALGETSSSAYRGDRGKIAYDHASAKGVAVSGFNKVTSNSEGHVTGGSPVTKADLVALGVEDGSNKVTAFGATPSDTNYPSEKLVKDNIDAINGVLTWE